MSFAELEAYNTYNKAYIGMACCLGLSCVGAAFGTSASTLYKSKLSVFFTIISGVLGIYGMIIAIIIYGQVNSDTTQYIKPQTGDKCLFGGIICGVACMVSGITMGFLQIAIRPKKQANIENQPEQDELSKKERVIMMLKMIFTEALGLYGLIISLIVIGHGQDGYKSTFQYAYQGMVYSISFACIGAGFATAMSKNFQELRFMIPTVMGGVLALYGLIISVIIAGRISSSDFTEIKAYQFLNAGITNGVCCLCAGVAIGFISLERKKKAVRMQMQQMQQVQQGQQGYTVQTPQDSELSQNLVSNQYPQFNNDQQQQQQQYQQYQQQQPQQLQYQQQLNNAQEVAPQPEPKADFVIRIIKMIFAEALGLYGLIVALVMMSTDVQIYSI